MQYQNHKIYKFYSIYMNVHEIRELISYNMYNQTLIEEERSNIIRL